MKREVLEVCLNPFIAWIGLGKIAQLHGLINFKIQTNGGHLS
jgi:hypothetical protein